VRPNESVERAVSIVASRLTSPVITDMRVYADGVRLLKTHPTQPADIFAGQDFVMLTRYNHSGTTRLHFTGMTANGPVEWSSRVVFPASSRENSFIARLWATQRVGYLSAEKRRHGESAEVNDEIRELGERYGIPTEFSSYLVLEPGMDRRVLSGLPAPPPATAGAVLRTDAAAAAPQARVAEGRFEAARVSAKQREATTLSMADEESGVSEKDALRRGSNRLFAMRDGVWTDTGFKESMQRVKIRAYSSAYFRLLEIFPDLREAFALGDKVIVAGRSIAIEVSPTGAESLGESELRSLQSKW
jgi:hypothetical protein